MTVFILCLQIFCFRILDVSLGVIRIILNVKKKPLFASLIGFVEVMTWFLIVRGALSSDEGGLFVAFAYALGFAAGTFIGGMLSKKFIKSKINVQIITSNRDDNLVSAIRSHGFPATVLHARGSSEEKPQRYLIFVEIDSHDYKNLKELILMLDPKAFITVNELTSSENGFFCAKNK